MPTSVVRVDQFGARRCGRDFDEFQGRRGGHHPRRRVRVGRRQVSGPTHPTAAAAVLLVAAAAACSIGSPQQPEASPRGPAEPTAPSVRGTVAGGVPLHGPYVPTVGLAGAAWDGRRLWLTDIDSRLLAIDGQDYEIVVDEQLPEPVADNTGLLLAPGKELWAITIPGPGQGAGPTVLRIDTHSGNVTAASLGGGLPFGQGVVHGGLLVVADFERGIVSIDPRDGSSRRLLPPKVVPNLIQIGEGDAWVVDDSRRRVIRFDPDGDRAADAVRDSPIAAMALDAIGNLWLAEGSAVVRLNEAAEVMTEIGGFTNASRLHICGPWLVVSDSDTGDIAWIDPRSAALSRRDSTGDGVVVACDEGGAWVATADGSIALLPPP